MFSVLSAISGTALPDVDEDLFLQAMRTLALFITHNGMHASPELRVDVGPKEPMVGYGGLQYPVDYC